MVILQVLFQESKVFLKGFHAILRQNSDVKGQSLLYPCYLDCVVYESATVVEVLGTK